MVNKTVVLGVSGGIAAYKTPHLVRLLRQSQLEVWPVLTKEAALFVSPMVLETLSGHPVYPHDATIAEAGIVHIDLARKADVLLIAPATAQTIAKLAHGLADDTLSSVALMHTGPLIIVPAMHEEMIDHPATQANLRLLNDRGACILGPEEGALACGDSGRGRMVELGLIQRAVTTFCLAPTPVHGLLKNQSLLITAGGTREYLDSVRILTNLSTGQLGHMLADVACLLGATVRLITTASAPSHPNVSVTKVETAAEMSAAVHGAIAAADTLIMAAAVSDFTVERSVHKRKRVDNDTPVLALRPTADILKSLQPMKGSRFYMGFCLEDQNLAAEARRKLTDKGADMIIANQPNNIGSDQRSYHVYTKEGCLEHCQSTTVLTMAIHLLTLVGQHSIKQP